LFDVAPTDWFVEWLDSFWDTLDEPVLYVASDEIDKVLPDFKKYNPVTLKDLKIEIPNFSFYPDHYILSQADILGLSNSTYASTAAMLNQKSNMIYRADHKLGRLVEHDPWDSLPYVQNDLLMKQNSYLKHLLEK